MDIKTRDLMTRAGLNLIQQALTIYDAKLRLVLSNRRFQEMFDLPAHLHKPGAAFSDCILHLALRGDYGQLSDIDIFVKERVEKAKSFTPHYMERVRANGQVISVEGTPLPHGGWVAVYTDITQIKRQEDMLRARSEELSGQLTAYSQELTTTNRKLASTISILEQSQQDLREVEARTRLTTEMMPAHIAHVGPDRRYTYSNKRLNLVMPGRPANIINRHIAEALGAQTYSLIEPHLNNALDGKSSVFEFTDELSSRRIRTAFTPDTSDPNQVSGVYVLSMDVTEEAQARATLQQQSKREMASHLTSGLAHDFSNLLTIIMGAQGRLSKFDLPPDARQLVDATLNAATRGGALLNSIADMVGNRAPHPQAITMKDVFDQLAPLAYSALDAQHNLILKPPKTDKQWLLDAGQLMDALLNLILNARDAIGQSGTITLAAKIVKDTWIEFVVTDTGQGFSTNALQHAFDPFFTTKGENGTGLGLSMVYDVAKMNGGSLVLQNGFRGARVTLRLPARQAIAQRPPGMALLVEDQTDLRDVFRNYLTGMGYSVIEASDAGEARALLGELSEITLILTDLQLKGEETGVDLISSLSDEKPLVLFMSSLPTTHPLVISAQRMAPVLAKPFEIGDLRATLKDVLNVTAPSHNS
jgi:signal transduction histidine kinase/CheY-like chemotaxis protein